MGVGISIVVYDTHWGFLTLTEVDRSGPSFIRTLWGRREMVWVGGSDQSPPQGMMLLLAMGFDTIATNQKVSRPIGILDWVTVSKMLGPNRFDDLSG